MFPIATGTYIGLCKKTPCQAFHFCYRQGKQPTMQTPSALPTAGIGRRLGAIVYDSLLLFALLMVAATPVVFILGGAPTGTTARTGFQLYMLLCVFGFFGWFWTRGGQTLGMRTWRLRLVQGNDEPVDWPHALFRFVLALLSWLCLGLGFLWIILDRDRLTLYDRLSKTRPVLMPASPSGRAAQQKDGQQ